MILEEDGAHWVSAKKRNSVIDKGAVGMDLGRSAKVEDVLDGVGHAVPVSGHVDGSRVEVESECRDGFGFRGGVYGEVVSVVSGRVRC